MQRRTPENVFQASFYHAGRRLCVYRSSDIHQAAYAVNHTNRLMNGPDSPDINVIAPEHIPDEQDRAAIEEKVRQYLAKRSLIDRHG